MLESLNGQPIGPFRLHVENVGRARFFDQRDFALYLIDSHANKSNSPIFRGRYNAGRPSIHVLSWIDGELVENATINGERIDLTAPLSNPRSLAEEMTRALGALIPPGGRFWIAYEAFEGEGEIVHETRAGLSESFPLVSTPVGFLLFRADCWLGLRNWHFPEGGREGPMKLQGNKALNEEHARVRAQETVAELENFLRKKSESEIEERAHARARIVLAAVKPIAQFNENRR